MRKQILLLVGAIAFLVVLFIIPIYNKWLLYGVLSPGTSIVYQAKRLSIRERMMIRFSCLYSQLNKVKADMHAAHADCALVLLPTDDFLQQHNVQCIHMPEPLVFYYFTGVRAVLANHPDADKATWTTEVQSNRQLAAVPIADAPMRDSLIREYKRYLPH